VEATPTIASALVAGVAGLVGALIGAAVSLRTSTRNIKIDNVTKERAKWRDRVRKKSLIVHQQAVKGDATALDELHLQFTLILNPFHSEDRAILALIRQLKTTADESHLTEFADRISLLLKHDWERAKWEAEDNWFQSLDPDAERKPEPKRISYDQYIRERGTQQP
jgi:hypothetical protein